MRVLLATGSPPGYMLPPQLGDEQVNCGPDWPDETGPDGRVRSIRTPAGPYDLTLVAAKLPPGQQPDNARKVPPDARVKPDGKQGSSQPPPPAPANP